MKHFVPSLGLSVALFVAIAGCGKSTLAPGGAYAPDPTTNSAGVVSQVAPDPAFFNVDLAYDTAYSAVNGVFSFERDNRLVLWGLSHDIKHTLDVVRPQAVTADKEYLVARAAYLANPTPSGLSALQSTLAKMQQLLSAAQAALPPSATAPTK